MKNSIHSGYHALKSLEKFITIMELLTEGAQSRPDIIKKTGYSYSTVSRYLRLIKRRFDRLQVVSLKQPKKKAVLRYWLE